MSVRHSPSGTPGRSPPGTPVPSEAENLESPLDHYTRRDGKHTFAERNPKRKHPHDHDFYLTELASFRTEVLSILYNHSCEQKNNVLQISEDIKTMKEQMQNIERKTDSILLEQNKQQREITDLKGSLQSTELKVTTMEKDIQMLKTTADTLPSKITTMDATLQCEDFISELRERSLRESNIIVTGVPEISSTVSNERVAHDIHEVAKIVQAATPGCSAPVNCIRLGRYKPGHLRSIRAIMTSADSAKDVLRHRQNLNLENVKIYSDRTPQQQKHLKLLKEELRNRQSQGETNIGIKYIKGVPKVVDLDKKN